MITCRITLKEHILIIWAIPFLGSHRHGPNASSCKRNRLESKSSQTSQSAGSCHTITDNNQKTATLQAKSFQLGAGLREIHFSIGWSRMPRFRMSSSAAHLPTLVNASGGLRCIRMNPTCSSSRVASAAFMLPRQSSTAFLPWSTPLR
jgi:hypothetical protein